MRYYSRSQGKIVEGEPPAKKTMADYSYSPGTDSIDGQTYTPSPVGNELQGDTNAIGVGLQGEYPGGSEETQARGSLFQNLGSITPAGVAKFLAPATYNIGQDVIRGADLKKEVDIADKTNKENYKKSKELIEKAKKTSDPVLKKQLLDESRKIMEGNVTPDTSGFSEDINKNYWERGLASGAELAPWVMGPGTALIKGAAGKLGVGATTKLSGIGFKAVGEKVLPRILSFGGQSAMAAGTRTATSLEDMTLGERAGATAKSAGLSFIFGTALQGLGELYKFSKGGNLTDTSTFTREQNINKFKMRSEARDPLGEYQQVNKAIENNLGKGAAVDKLGRYPQAMTSLNKKIQSEIAKSTKPLDITKIGNEFVDDFTKNTIYPKDDPGVVKAWIDNVGKISAIKGNTPAEINSAIYGLKSEIPIAPILKKINLGTALTPVEEARYSLWSVLKNNLDDISPNIRTLNTEQHLLMSAKEGLIKSAEGAQPSIPIPGVIKNVKLPVSTQAGQNVSSALGTVGGNIKSAYQGLPSVSASKIGPLATTTISGISTPNLPRVSVSGESGQYPANEGQNYPDSQYMQGDTNHITPSISQSEAQEVSKLKGLIASAENARMSGDTAIADQYDKLVVNQLKIIDQMGSKAKPLSGTNSVLLVKSQVGKRMVEKIWNIILQNPNISLERALNPLSQEGRLLGASLASAIDILGYFRTGAAITADQRKDYIYMFPSALDYKQGTAKEKLNELYREFAAYEQGLLKSGGGEVVNQDTSQSFNRPAVGKTASQTTQTASLPRITQPFGKKNPKIERFSRGGVNRGVDYAVKTGTPLYTPEGEWSVLEAFGGSRRSGFIGNRDNKGYGNSIVLRNTKTGEKIRLSHLQKVNVKAGQKVTGGQLVALSGNTGNSTGAHADIEYVTSTGRLADASKTKYVYEIFRASA